MLQRFNFSHTSASTTRPSHAKHKARQCGAAGTPDLVSWCVASPVRLAFFFGERGGGGRAAELMLPQYQ